MESNIYQIIESIKADYKRKRTKKKSNSGIDQGIKSLGVALKFKIRKKELEKI